MKIGATFAAPLLLGLLCAAIWVLGPAIGYDDLRPLETPSARITAIAALVCIGIAVVAARYVLARPERRSGAREVDAHAMEKAVDRLIEFSAGRKSRRPSPYSLPWYLVIGDGSTLIAEPGLIPVPVDRPPEGRPTISLRLAEGGAIIDASAIADDVSRLGEQSSLLFALKRRRPLQPLNGILLAVDIGLLASMPSKELRSTAQSWRESLTRVTEPFGIDVPVYLVFTRTDTIPGFSAFVQLLEPAQREEVFGLTFDARRRTQDSARSAEFDLLARRISDITTDRLGFASFARTRLDALVFVAQFAALKPTLLDFVSPVFDGSDNWLRGIYFTGASGDVRSPDADRQSSHFVQALLRDVVFAEPGIAGLEHVQVRRARFGRIAGLAATAGFTAIVLAAIAFGYFRGETMNAAALDTIERLRAGSSDLLVANDVEDAALEQVVDPLDTLRDLSIDSGSGRLPDRVAAFVGLPPRAKLQAAAFDAYQSGLERMLRPRLMIELETVITAAAATPDALYEPLAVYLMLAGAAPAAETDRIASWFERHWREVRYPGAQNRSGREALAIHLMALLGPVSTAPRTSMDETLVAASQRALGQLPLARLAKAMIGAGGVITAPEDFSVIARGGSEAALVFRMNDGSGLSEAVVPGFYTRRGFFGDFLQSLATLPRRLSEERWVLGGGGQVTIAEQELRGLGPELVDAYGQDFVRNWNAVLDRLDLQPLADDPPAYAALAAVASENSPIRLLIEAVAEETSLAARMDNAGNIPTPSAEMDSGLARLGLVEFTGKSGARAGFADAPRPGAFVETQFRPFRDLVSGREGQRPIDVIIRNLADIHQSMKLAEALPAQAARISANLQIQIANLRTNASRLPRRLGQWFKAAASDFEGEASQTSLTLLNERLKSTLLPACTATIEDRYPFSSAGAEEASMADFAALFSPGGTIDRFFAQNLSGFVDTSGDQWRWTDNAKFGQPLSSQALAQFQLAARIRDTFFADRETLPSIEFTVTPLSLNPQSSVATLEIDGQTVTAYPTGNVPMAVTWPGRTGGGSASLTLEPDLVGRQSRIAFDGPWAFKRLLDAFSPSRSGDGLEARFIIDGRDATFGLKAVRGLSALFQLSEFRCPDSL